VVCEACKEAQEVDEIVPACMTEAGCLIPPLSETGARILDIRGLIVGLKDLIDPGTIIAVMGGLDPEDLRLMATAEAFIAAQEKVKKNGDDGQ